MSTFTSPPSYSLCGVAGEFLLSVVGILATVQVCPFVVNQLPLPCLLVDLAFIRSCTLVTQSFDQSMEPFPDWSI